MDSIDVISFGMLLMVIMGIGGMYIHAIDLAGVVTIEGLAVAVSIGAAQLQKYRCNFCALYQKASSKGTPPNAPE